MASTSPRQRRITGRVMHEFKHGELKRGRSGKAGKVKSRRQAIAIALEEAGKSKYESGRRNRRNLRRTENKEAKGRTGQQEREGKSHVGARGKRESARAMYGWARCSQNDRKRPQSLAGALPKKRWSHPTRTLCQSPEATHRGALKDEQASTGKCTWSALSFSFSAW
jgi:hypothetical protein